jgi:hypothetical protein
LHWQQLDWLLLQRQVPTLRFQSELGLEAIMAILAITGIILIAITDRIRTMATIMGLRTTGTAGIVAITGIIAIITTITRTKKADVKVRKFTELAWKQFRASSFLGGNRSLAQ